MAYLIGIDIGTSGTKCALFDEAGTLKASHTVGYPMAQPQNGYAEQDPEDWWQATLEGLKAVGRAVPAADIRGIGLSGQMHGLVMLDAAGKVLRPSIIWCDQRTAAECGEITRRVGADRLMAITASPALTGFTASKILWVRNHEPEHYAACRHILLPKDYIRYRLTGELATDASDASGMQLLDIERRDWSPEVLEKLDIDRALLAPVYESPEVTGGLTAGVAAVTGLAPGTPVVGGAGDNAASAVGTGVVRDGNAFVTIGTSGVIFAHASQMNPDPKGRIHTFCCAVPGAWHVMAVTQAAGLSLKWLRGQLGYDDYDAMTALAATAPIGSRRLLYLPYLMGERTPHLDANARGAFVGLSGIHGHADLIRAVLEGVAFSLADGMDIIRACGVSVETLMACGGGGSSPMWRQLIADVLNTPLCIASSTEGGAFGAALLAGVGAGIYASVPEACDATIRPGGRQEPDPASHAAYEPYCRIYRGLYPALSESFHGLSAL